MSKNKVLVNIATYELTKNINSEYIILFNDLYKKSNIVTNIYYFWDKICNNEYEDNLATKWIYLVNYKNETSLNELILDLNSNSEIIYINTFTELLIDTTIRLKELLNQKVSKFKDIFRNKDIQRRELLKYNSDITIKFLERTIDNIKLDEIEKFIWYPFILKPANWIQSAWVSKISNKKDFEVYLNSYKDFLKNFKNRWYYSDTILVEEFIDWKLYSVDYFISESWSITSSNPVRVVLWSDLWIDDFFNYSRIVSEWVEKDFLWIDLKLFISESVKWAWIRNNFVHHEFKINSKWELKTIELNWRIWWFRAWIYKRAYNLNLLNFIIWKQIDNKIISNDWVVNVYSETKWILKWFNIELLEKIKTLESVTFTNIYKKYIWEEVWLTKDWFWRLAVFKLNNDNYLQFESDYKFIESNHKDLLILE